MMNKKLAIAGIQGSGKGTQAAKLVEKLDLEFIGVGDLLRWNVENGTEHGKVAKEAMQSGKLVSDDTVKGILSDKLDSLDPKKGFLLDGFPRNEAQRAWLLENYQVDGCIYLDIEDEEQVVQRMLARKKCPSCGMEHNLINVPTENKCNGCGAELVQRADDNETAIRQRLSAYHEETKPVLNWFEQNGNLFKIDATGEIEEVFGRIISALEA
ncbi:MAG: nucleoside monophosphate kinase [Fibrobacterales bacterium]